MRKEDAMLVEAVAVVGSVGLLVGLGYAANVVRKRLALQAYWRAYWQVRQDKCPEGTHRWRWGHGEMYCGKCHWVPGKFA